MKYVPEAVGRERFTTAALPRVHYELHTVLIQA
jgi:hypothetical protein